MKRNLLTNKRGDIPITILVIGVLTICIFAVFSFYFSDRAIRKNLGDIGLIEESAILKEKILVYRELGFSSDEIDEIFGIKKDAIGNYILLNKGSLSVKNYVD